MIKMDELLETLDRDYPDTATMLMGMDDKERDQYLAKIELINHIKMLNEPKKKDKR